jgi:6-phosphogluconate dehydrogenase
LQFCANFLHSLLFAGKWTVQQAAELSVAAPTITSSLDGRYMSALKDQRVAASKVFGELGLKVGQRYVIQQTVCSV